MNRALAAVLVSILSSASATAYAHGAHGAASSFSAGFAHPFSGLDHAFAMIAIGVFAAQARFATGLGVAGATWVALVAGTLFAGSVAAAPFFEALVAMSVCALGLLLLGRRGVVPAFSLACIVLFAFAHGAIHAIEQPVEFSNIGYVGGVLVASIVLQAAGASIARILAHRALLAAVPLTAAGAWILIASMA
jgi:urease accessory protein